MTEKKDTRKKSEVLPFDKLRDTGILWLINTTVFHPRGMALGLNYNDDGEADGWVLYVDKETWVFLDDDANKCFNDFNEFIEKILGCPECREKGYIPLGECSLDVEQGYCKTCLSFVGIGGKG